MERPETFCAYLMEVTYVTERTNGQCGESEQ
jgi:hypothetical protein